MNFSFLCNNCTTDSKTDDVISSTTEGSFQVFSFARLPLPVVTSNDNNDNNDNKNTSDKIFFLGK